MTVFKSSSEENKQTEIFFQNVIKLLITLLKMTHFIVHNRQFLNIT